MRLPFMNRFRRIAANATGLVGTRLALFGLELQEELERQVSRFALLTVVFMCAAFTLLFASLVLLVLAWQHGVLLPAAICLAALFAALTLGAALWFRRSLRAASPAFARTLAEFKGDEASLRGAETGSDELTTENRKP